MSTPTKLRSVLDDAKRHLGERAASPSSSEAASHDAERPNHEPARSKLNTLRGVTSVEQRPLSVFQRVGVPQRPTYDLIAERVLGPDVPQHRNFLEEGSTYADHVAMRLRQLQERLNSPAVDESENGAPSAYVGVEDDGRPVWSQVLEQQRGRASYGFQGLSENEPPSQPAPSSAVKRASIPDWPARLTWSNERTFKQWFVAEENFDATRLCEAVVDAPGQRFNPLFLQGDAASGISLLLHATGQAMLRRNEGHVLVVSAADLHGVDPTVGDWQEALAGATALFVDDLHLFATEEHWNRHMGVMLDRALNLGVHVLVGSRLPLDALPPSRLKEVLLQATVASLQSPSVGTMMAYARWRSAQKNLLLADPHLAQIAREHPAGWATVDGRLERVALALESGGVLLDQDDLTVFLEGGPSAASDALESKRIEDVAASMVGEVLDSVYSSVEPGGIDLRTNVEPWGEDDYLPPSLDEDLTAATHTTTFEQNVRESIDHITPGRPTVLDVHEREKYLISNREPLNIKDVERAVDVLVDLDENIESRLLRTEQTGVEASIELNRLEEKMVMLGQRALEAEIDELITIADELRSIEERLVELDPERGPLPPFEANAPAKTRRKVGRRSSPKRKKNHEQEPEPVAASSLDSYEPEGEWNVDDVGISADDLLNEEAMPRVPVRLSRIHPRTVLVGEEE